MENDFKKEARKQFFKYFRVLFIILVITAVLAILALVSKLFKSPVTRENSSADEERVFDSAEVLTDEEESDLRDYIAKCEEQYHMDIVLVTINENVEAEGYWDTVMRDKADDFYDMGNYGYDKVHGDGILILDNWYTDENGSQKGSWVSTCGKVYERFDTYDIDNVLDEIDWLIDSNPHDAYEAAISRACDIYDSYNNGKAPQIPILLVIFGPIVAALIFALTKLRQVPAKDTTTLMQYVESGSQTMNRKSDDFIRKSTTSHRIESSSSGGSGGRSGGHGGGHVSRGGVSHGGGGRRR